MPTDPVEIAREDSGLRVRAEFRPDMPAIDKAVAGMKIYVHTAALLKSVARNLEPDAPELDVGDKRAVFDGADADAQPIYDALMDALDSCRADDLLMIRSLRAEAERLRGLLGEVTAANASDATMDGSWRNPRWRDRPLAADLLARIAAELRKETRNVTALRVALAIRGWSAAELARICGTRAETIRAYLSDSMRPSADSLDVIRAALGPALEQAEREHGEILTRERGQPRRVASS